MSSCGARGVQHLHHGPVLPDPAAQARLAHLPSLQLPPITAFSDASTANLWCDGKITEEDRGLCTSVVRWYHAEAHGMHHSPVLPDAAAHNYIVGFWVYPDSVRSGRRNQKLYVVSTQPWEICTFSSWVSQFQQAKARSTP